MLAAMYREAPEVPAFTLFDDLPAFNPRAAALLIAAYASDFPAGCVFCCVVDPGVGSNRAPLVVRAGGRYFVGPDNGVLAIALRHYADPAAWEITWQPEKLSNTFHGRDVFAPISAALARDGEKALEKLAKPKDLQTIVGRDWPAEIAEIIYIDSFGNCMTGLRSEGQEQEDAKLHVKNKRISHARTYSEMPIGELFWYENANGLIEIAQNQGSAAQLLDLKVGDLIEMRSDHGVQG